MNWYYTKYNIPSQVYFLVLKYGIIVDSMYASGTIECRQVHSPTIYYNYFESYYNFIIIEYTFKNAAIIDVITWTRGKACEYACVEAYSLEGDLTCDESIVLYLLPVCKMHIVFMACT